MKFVFTELSWEDYLFWQKNDKQKLKRINELLKDISRNPYEGIGKPEPLRFNYAGFWSRRIPAIAPMASPPRKPSKTFELFMINFFWC